MQKRSGRRSVQWSCWKAPRLKRLAVCRPLPLQARTSTYCSHTATHRNTQQHTATHCNTLQHTAAHCSTLHYTTTHCNTLQHTATHYNTLQHALQHTHCNTANVPRCARDEFSFRCACGIPLNTITTHIVGLDQKRPTYMKRDLQKKTNFYEKRRNRPTDADPTTTHTHKVDKKSACL